MNSIVNFASFTAHFPRFVLISVNRLTNEADTMTPPRGNGLIPGCRRKSFPRLGARTFLRRDNRPPIVTKYYFN